MCFKIHNGCAIMIDHLQKVIALAESELNNKNSKWDKEVIENVVLREMRELHDHFVKGEKYFKYGKRQRMLGSTYYMTDTLDNLWVTELGKAISELQDIYRRI